MVCEDHRAALAYGGNGQNEFKQGDCEKKRNQHQRITQDEKGRQSPLQRRGEKIEHGVGSLTFSRVGFQ